MIGVGGVAQAVTKEIERQHGDDDAGDQRVGLEPVNCAAELGDDVAALAVHIMSNDALTGATYDVDGGQQLLR